MKKISILVFVLLFTFAKAQESSVEAKGTGVGRTDALQDALRNAVSQAVGVTLSSNTMVENFMVISDAIASQTQGYIKSYSIKEEKNTAEGYQVTVSAVVTTKAMKADFSLLAKGIGGVRFMAIYDTRSVPASEVADYNLAVDQMNAYFSSKKYRYIERTRFLQLQKEAMLLMEDNDTSGVSYAQQLALLADAQFIIMIKNINIDSQSENFDTKNSHKVSIQTMTYDNCTSEGLSNRSLESNYEDAGDQAKSIKNAISEAVKKDMDNVLDDFSSYIGSWINNGIPYELRFYDVGGFRDLRELRTKLKSDVLFGGEMEMVGAQDFTKVNCTYKKKPDELADKILDFSDQIPALATKKIDVKLIYGRQISFAPQGVAIKKKKVKDVITQAEQERKPDASNTSTPTASTETKEEKHDPKSPGIMFFSEAGEKFWLIVNGEKQNEKPATKAWKNNFNDATAKIRIIFQNNKIPTIDQTVFLNNFEGTAKYNISYVVKKKPKGNYVIRMVNANPTEGNKDKTWDMNQNNQDFPNQKVETKTEEDDFKTSSNFNATVLNADDFLEQLNMINAETFSSSRIAMIKQLAKSQSLSVAQIRQLVSGFNFDQEKLDIVKIAYNACSDKQKYYTLTNVFTFMGTKTEFNKFLDSKK